MSPFSTKTGALAMAVVGYNGPSGRRIAHEEITVH